MENRENKSMSSIYLDKVKIGDIEGEFIVPAYQRGFRWKDEVKILLDDINDIIGGQEYCLQPIVVKKTGEKNYELIDGQQWLTSVFLLLRYMIQLGLPFRHKFSIKYETRDNSRIFLENISIGILDNDINNIDEYFFIEAYRIITSWFKSQKDEPLAALNIYKKLCESIFAIWYEVDSGESSVSLFTRLNIGRIPLTNAELVKALFLSKNSEINDNKQPEIATDWDIIEKELHNNSFWYFITNENHAQYQTRIELIFNLMSGKQGHEKENFYTFFFFDKKIKEKNNKPEVWTEIKRFYQRLQEWFENPDLYHKIGYLIASNHIGLLNLIEKSSGITKTEFQNSLDSLIAESIAADGNYNDLSYESRPDYLLIEKILLLFNVETIRQKSDESMRFPFNKYKQENWSLEHIHAQQSEGLNKKEQWVEWLNLHKESLLSLKNEKNDGLIKDITGAVNDENLNFITFFDLFEKVIKVLSKDDSIEYTHFLSNLALLKKSDNSALNNSAFAVKRNRILGFDKKSDYIPECTRRVFLKYYTQSEYNQLHFWGKSDRDGYINEMNNILHNYLKIIGKEIVP
jgi:uncharacterized protein with ParB-like and HNH nuclease domain